MTDRRLPGPRGGASLTAARRLLDDPAPELDALAARYGPVVGLGIRPLRIAVVGGPAEVSDLLAMPVDRFRWNHRVNVLGFVVGSSSLLVSDGPDHRRRRGAVMPGFGRRRLAGWVPSIVAQVDRAADRMVADSHRDPAGARDLTPRVRELTIAVITETMLGRSLAPRAREVGALFVRPQAYLESPAVRQVPHPFPGTRRARVRRDRAALDRIIDEEVARVRAGTDTLDRRDVLADMVTAGTLTDAEIRDQVVTLIGAGYDTTAAALAWTLWRAASTPGLWARLRAEADAATTVPRGDEAEGGGAEGDGTTPSLDLAALDLAGRTVRESLRLHPPGLGGVREAAVDIDLAGHRIPAGTIVLWSPYLTGRDPSVWPDPLRFDPDRFVDLTSEQQAAADRAWVPFGRGARTCIGFALAPMELTLALSRLAQRLDLTPAHGEIPAPRGMVVNRPSGGIPFRVRERAGDLPPTVLVRDGDTRCRDLAPEPGGHRSGARP